MSDTATNTVVVPKKDSKKESKKRKIKQDTQRDISSDADVYSCDSYWGTLRQLDMRAAPMLLNQIVGDSAGKIYTDNVTYDNFLGLLRCVELMQQQLQDMRCSSVVTGTTPAAAPRRGKTYRATCPMVNGGRAVYTNLPFQPRDTELAGNEEFTDDSQPVGANNGDHFESTFLRLTSAEIDALELVYPGLRATAQLEPRTAQPPTDAALCVLCGVAPGKTSPFCSSLRCHRLCCCCAYARLLVGCVACPVAGCPTLVALQQLGSIYAHLRRQINRQAPTPANDQLSPSDSQ